MRDTSSPSSVSSSAGTEQTEAPPLNDGEVGIAVAVLRKQAASPSLWHHAALINRVADALPLLAKPAPVPASIAPAVDAGTMDKPTFSTLDEEIEHVEEILVACKFHEAARSLRAAYNAHAARSLAVDAGTTVEQPPEGRFPLLMVDNFARRSRLDLYWPAERAIQKAVDAVEMTGADVALTDAVILLGKAKDRVADYVDAQLRAGATAPSVTESNPLVRSVTSPAVDDETVKPEANNG